MPTAKQRVKAAHRKRFREAVEELNAVMREVRKYEPKANYYLAMEELHLLLGSSHDDRGRAQQQRSAESATLLGSGGGDW